MAQELITPNNTSGANTASVRSKPAGVNDRVPEQVISELVRRLYVIIQDETDSKFVFSVTAPEDKTKVWYPTDVAGIPQGRPRIWDAGTSAWVEIEQDAEAVELPKQATGSFFTAAGGSVQAFDFPTFGDTNYDLSLVPTLYIDGEWAASPDTVPDKFAWLVASKSATSVTVRFYAVPTGGLTWEWTVTERTATPA